MTHSNFRIYLIAICVVLVPVLTNGQRVADQIYMKLDSSTSQCFRLLNGTHQVGCQSKENGNTGIIYLVESSAELDAINQDSGNYGEYIVAIDARHFDEFASALQRMPSIVGVLLMQRNSEPLGSSGISEDAACPNERTSMYSEDAAHKCDWNPTQTAAGVRFLDWTKPIFLIDNATEIDIIVKSCWETFNKPVDGMAREFPVCAATLTQFMTAAKDAPTCLRRQEMFAGLSGDTTLHLCDPLIDENIIAFLPPTNKTAKQMFEHESVFVLTARMDSFSMFSDRTPGEESAISGVITLLAVANAIGQKREQFSSAARQRKHYLLFALLHGESLDYIGSSRMLYDMNQTKFPVEASSSVKDQVDQLTIDHIGFVLELNQIGSSGGEHFAHVDGTVYSGIKREKIDTVLKDTGFSLADDSNTSRLPPASYQQFLKHSHSIPGFVIGDYKTKFNNKYYNSFADSDNLDAAKAIDAITKVAESSLKAVTNWVANESTGYTIDRDYIKDLYDCFITKKFWDECEILKRATTYLENKAIVRQKTTYIGTQGSMEARSSPIKRIANVLMVGSLGEKLPNVDTKEQCGHLSGLKKNNMYSYFWQLDLLQSDNASYCYQSTVMQTPAQSPAFLIEDYDMTSGKYSTWVESVWAPSVSLKLFLRPPPRYSLWIFLTAMVVLLVSMAICLLLHRISPLLIDAHPGADIGDPSL
uniref:Nicastrin n=1 Tax=Plectus sambesii TaxID=2011161 RepID=A0A914WXV5_9BILA